MSHTISKGLGIGKEKNLSIVIETPRTSTNNIEDLGDLDFSRMEMNNLMSETDFSDEDLTNW